MSPGVGSSGARVAPRLSRQAAAASSAWPRRSEGRGRGRPGRAAAGGGRAPRVAGAVAAAPARATAARRTGLMRRSPRAAPSPPRRRPGSSARALASVNVARPRRSWPRCRCTGTGPGRHVRGPAALGALARELAQRPLAATPPPSTTAGRPRRPPRSAGLPAAARTASWKDAARSRHARALGGAARSRTDVERDAVLTPPNEKSDAPAPRCRREPIARGSPSPPGARWAGPPGSPSPSSWPPCRWPPPPRRRGLPEQSRRSAQAGARSRRVWPPETTRADEGQVERVAGSRQAARCGPRRWFTTDQGLPARVGERLGRRDADQQRADQAGPLGDRQAVDVVQADAGLGQRPVDHRHRPCSRWWRAPAPAPRRRRARGRRPARRRRSTGCVRPSTTAAAVSSQEVSIARIGALTRRHLCPVRRCAT